MFFYLSSTQSTIPHGCLTFSLIESPFEFFDLFSVPLNQSLRIDDFFLRRTELGKNKGTSIQGIDVLRHCIHSHVLS